MSISNFGSIAVLNSCRELGSSCDVTRFDEKDADGNFVHTDLNPGPQVYLAAIPKICSPIPTYEEIKSTLWECGDAHKLQTAPAETVADVAACDAAC